MGKPPGGEQTQQGLIALTGATGFIGTSLCKRLREEGYRVRALVRSPARAEALLNLGIETTSGDLHQEAALTELVTGASAVIHCAGAVRGSSYRDFEFVNVTGTENLLQAVSQHSPEARFLLLSSLAARQPELSWYARSKRQAEKTLLQHENLDCCVLRPPAVYGPGDEEMKAIFDWMARGIALVPGSAQARNSLVHVEDLVEACLACLAQPLARGKTYTVCDGKAGGYDWAEMAAIAEQVWQRPVHLFSPPRPLLNSIASLNLGLSRLIGRSPMLTPGKLRELRHPDWVTDNEKISQDTGWEPRIGLLQGLQALVDSAL